MGDYKIHICCLCRTSYPIFWFALLLVQARSGGRDRCFEVVKKREKYSYTNIIAVFKNITNTYISHGKSSEEKRSGMFNLHSRIFYFCEHLAFLCFFSAV